MDYVLKTMSIEEDAKDVRRFVVVRPAGFTFEPGKSIMISVNKPGLEENKKKSTFFSLKNDYYLELVLKENPLKEENRPFYELKSGEEIIVSDVVGNLEYLGKGAFLVAEKGIIPVLNIFKHLQKMDALQGNQIIYFVREENELIFPRMVTHVFRNNCTIILGKNPQNILEVKKIDENILKQKLPSMQQKFYIAGPKYFVDDASRLLHELSIQHQAEILD